MLITFNSVGQNTLVADYAYSTSCAEHIVAFENMSRGSMVSCLWDFGDGNTSTLINPTNKYTLSGNYNVSLTISDGFGGTNTVNRVINVVKNTPLDISNCACELPSYVPNYSLENMNCCPSAPAELSCAQDWVQASAATSDYFNTCGILTRGGVANPPLPLPNGNGYAGTWNGVTSGLFADPIDNTYKEYLGACLLQNLVVGKSYNLSFKIAIGSGLPAFEVGVFGSSNCADLPFGGNDMYFGCPTNDPNYVKLASRVVNVTPGTWHTVNFTIVPTQNITTLVIGPDCSPAILPSGGFGGNYYFYDEIQIKSSIDVAIDSSGRFCEDLILNASSTVNNGHFMWFKDDLELVGETQSQLNITDNNYGAGNYKVMYVVGDFCVVDSVNILSSPMPVADFDFNDVCLGDETHFKNKSYIMFGDIVSWIWEIDRENRDTKDVDYTYTDVGLQEVTLYVVSDQGCKDTISQNVKVNQNPTANFEVLSDMNDIFNTEVCFQNNSIDVLNHTWSYGFNNYTSNVWDECVDFPTDKGDTYEVCLEAINNEGCVDRMCKEVFIKPKKLIYVPNSFTPNGNNINEVFIPYLTGIKIENYEFLIFNRWGEVIFKSTTLTEGWDGTFKGLPVSQGTYVWKLNGEVIYDDKVPEVLTNMGHVNVIR